MHGSEVLVFRLDADNFFRYLNGVRVLGVQSCYKCISISGFYHHHTEVVAFEHLIVCFLIVGTFASTLFAEDASVAFAAFCFAVMTQVYYFYAFQTQVEFFSQFLYTLFVAKKDRLAQTFGFCFYGSLQHIWVNTFGKYHTLRIAASHSVKLAGKFVFLSHQLAQLVLISRPIGNLFTCYARFHSRFSHSHRYFGDKTWVYWFRDEIRRAECKVVHMISVVHYIGYRLLCQCCDGVYGCQFHLFIDGGSAGI